MAAPTPIGILADLKTTLEGITIANGYKTDVNKVRNVILTWEGARERPEIGIYSERTGFAHMPFHEMRSTMTVRLVAHVDAATSDARVTAIENLSDDMIAAVMLAPTRAGCAIDTKITGYTTDQNDPDALDSRGWGATMVMTLEIMYDRTTAIS